MMPPFWVVFWLMLPPLGLLSGPDRCDIHESNILQSESSLLKSLECHNDYKSHVHCKWTQRRNTTLQLYFKKDDNGQAECVQNVTAQDAVQDASEHTTVQCTYNTRLFSIGITHTVFFLEKETQTLCSSVPRKPLDLSQHLRARPPVSLSTHGAGDGGRLLSWSSPYPSSSSLNRNITYQLSYRPARHNNWMTEDVTNTSLKLEKHLLLPGCNYEAKVRARTSVGEWSHWSRVVTWQTEKEAGQLPSLHCVLEGEEEVMCSWKVSKEVAHFITYRLACRHNNASASEGCCVNPAVSSELGGTMLKYSCSLTVADPAHLLLELLPTRNAKTFLARQHIRPNPPLQVNVKKKDRDWIVEWSSEPSEPDLYYQVCYHSTQEETCSTLLNISGCTFLSIPGGSLVPSQRHQVKVRSLVLPGKESMYKGIPSEWTYPEYWISEEATWSLSTLIYLSIGLFVAIVFLTLYCSVPACQRRVILWVDSVPSPGKSKILSEIKSATSRTLIQSEDTFMCKVQRMDSISTCSSDVSLWSTKDTEKKRLEQDEGCWMCDNPPSNAEKVNSSDTSSMSFSGPYIFCQSPEPNCKSVGVQCEATETPSDDSSLPSPMNFTLFGEGYVSLPNRSVSRSTQDLVSHSSANTNTRTVPEQDQLRPDTTPVPDKTDGQPGISKPTGSHQPPAYTSLPFTPWPQEVTVQPSGYCRLPAAHVTEK